MGEILSAFSVELAQVAYPLMSACAFIWLVEAVRAWKIYRRIEHVTRAFWYLAILVQFNWLAVLAGAPWWIPDMTPYRPYIRFGWSLVALAWALHTLTMIKVWRDTKQHGN
jgi:hypothetical protein